MKRPFDVVKYLHLDGIVRLKNTDEKIFEHTDKLVVWIVGFSIAGFATIISTPKTLDHLMSPPLIKAILYLLAGAVFFGVVFRISFFFYLKNYSILIDKLHVAFNDLDMANIQANDISHIDDIKVVLHHLKDDFDDDCAEARRLYEEATSEEIKKAVLESLKLHHSKLREWAKKDFDNAMKFTKDTYKEVFDFSEKQFAGAYSNKKRARLYKVSSKVTFFSLLLCCACFLAVFVIFLIRVSY